MAAVVFLAQKKELKKKEIKMQAMDSLILHRIFFHRIQVHIGVHKQCKQTIGIADDGSGDGINGVRNLEWWMAKDFFLACQLACLLAFECMHFKTKESE